MLRKVFSCGGMLLLAGAVILATPGPSQARGGGHGGGGHFGGGHFGGGHFGGAHFGGAHFGGAHFGGGHFGGARFGGFHRGGFGYYPFYGLYGAYPSYGGYGYYPSYGGYNYYPSYSGYDYYPSYIDSSMWSSPSYAEGYPGLYGEDTSFRLNNSGSAAPQAGSYQSFYPAATAEPDNRAHVTGPTSP
jgi:hypothetical protein